MGSDEMDAVLVGVRDANLRHTLQVCVAVCAMGGGVSGVSGMKDATWFVCTVHK